MSSIHGIASQAFPLASPASVTTNAPASPSNPIARQEDHIGDRLAHAGAEIAGGWIGVSLGGNIGGEVGALLGAIAGTVAAPGAGTIAGEALGGMLGGFAGSIAGGIAGARFGEATADNILRA
jgi:hypothetical protein